MNKVEALAVLREHLSAWQERSYADLATEMDGCSCTDVIGTSGTPYQIEIQISWDDKPGGDIRVIGAIDDMGIRAYFPLTDSFIMVPDGSLLK